MKASELQKSMEKSMSICGKEAEDKYFVFLTDDILIDILKRLPEPFLGYRAKYVCKRWLDVISKRNLLANASFILQKKGNMRARLVGIKEEGEEGLQVKVQDLEIPDRRQIRSWGNEFLLISESKKQKTSLYVYNLLNKETSYLPKCNASCGGNCSDKCGAAICFDGFTGIHKVVHLFPGPPMECHVLILKKDIGSSKWKEIQVPCMNGGWLLSHKLVSVQGRYIHWRVYDDTRLASMDVMKEEIVIRDVPIPSHGFGSYRVFEMGGSLALLAGVSKDEGEIWILRNFQRNSWEKLKLLTLMNWYSERSPVCGVISSSNKYIILESVLKHIMWYYDLKSGVVKKLDIHMGFDDRCMVHSSPPSLTAA